MKTIYICLIYDSAYGVDHSCFKNGLNRNLVRREQHRWCYHRRRFERGCVLWNREKHLGASVVRCRRVNSKECRRRFCCWSTRSTGPEQRRCGRCHEDQYRSVCLLFLVPHFERWHQWFLDSACTGHHLGCSFRTPTDQAHRLCRLVPGTWPYHSKAFRSQTGHTVGCVPAPEGRFLLRASLRDRAEIRPSWDDIRWWRYYQTPDPDHLGTR